jgi:archaemetzincin
MHRLIFVVILLLIAACRHLTSAGRVVVLQPLGTFSDAETYRIQEKLQKCFKKVIVRHAIRLPEAAFYAPRQRYRADSLLRMLAQQGGSDTVIVGLVNEDISTTKGDHADWGVMGLGYRPGSACVVSPFRLNRSNASSQFYKVVIHELGHTQGLPHCPDRRCFMRDAEGGNPLDEEVHFCRSCSAFLQSKGWSIQRFQPS